MSGAEAGKLGGLVRRKLVRELAAEEVSRSDLARRYDVTPAAITAFAHRNAEEITAVRANMDDEFAGILIANKAARLAAYEELYKVAVSPTPKVATNGKTVTYFDPETGQTGTVMEVDARAAAGILKNVAEEMGQLPTRLQVAGGLDVTTKYVVEGVNPSDLQ